MKYQLAGMEWLQPTVIILINTAAFIHHFFSLIPDWRENQFQEKNDELKLAAD